MTHIGSRATGKTKCGKPIARRWWVEDRHQVGISIAGVPLGNATIEPQGADCPACVKAYRTEHPDATKEETT